jgi:hypothetical protein
MVAASGVLLAVSHIVDFLDRQPRPKDSSLPTQRFVQSVRRLCPLVPGQRAFLSGPASCDFGDAFPLPEEVKVDTVSATVTRLPPREREGCLRAIVEQIGGFHSAPPSVGRTSEAIGLHISATACRGPTGSSCWTVNSASNSAYIAGSGAWLSWFVAGESVTSPSPCVEPMMASSLRGSDSVVVLPPCPNRFALSLQAYSFPGVLERAGWMGTSPGCVRGESLLCLDQQSIHNALKRLEDVASRHGPAHEAGSLMGWPCLRCLASTGSSQTVVSEPSSEPVERVVDRMVERVLAHPMAQGLPAAVAQDQFIAYPQRKSLSFSRGLEPQRPSQRLLEIVELVFRHLRGEPLRVETRKDGGKGGPSETTAPGDSLRWVLVPVSGSSAGLALATIVATSILTRSLFEDGGEEDDGRHQAARWQARFLGHEMAAQAIMDRVVEVEAKTWPNVGVIRASHSWLHRVFSESNKSSPHSDHFKVARSAASWVRHDISLMTAGADPAAVHRLERDREWAPFASPWGTPKDTEGAWVVGDGSGIATACRAESTGPIVVFTGQSLCTAVSLSGTSGIAALVSSGRVLLVPELRVDGVEPSAKRPASDGSVSLSELQSIARECGRPLVVFAGGGSAREGCSREVWEHHAARDSGCLTLFLEPSHSRTSLPYAPPGMEGWFLALDTVVQLECFFEASSRSPQVSQELDTPWCRHAELIASEPPPPELLELADIELERLVMERQDVVARVVVCPLDFRGSPEELLAWVVAANQSVSVPVASDQGALVTDRFFATPFRMRPSRESLLDPNLAWVGSDPFHTVSSGLALSTGNPSVRVRQKIVVPGVPAAMDSAENVLGRALLSEVFGAVGVTLSEAPPVSDEGCSGDVRRLRVGGGSERVEFQPSGAGICLMLSE